MKKRLRKKLHRGEFTQFGFSLHLAYESGLSLERYEAAFDTVIGVIESLNLQVMGGGRDTDFWGFISRYKGTCTDQDRESLAAALQALPCVVSVRTDPLEDAWK
jgi:uncharacterized protein YggL (DUF469 family)